MALVVRYHPGTGIIESTVSGNVSPAELKDETVQAADLALRHDCTRFLSDFSQATIAFSLFDVLKLPSLQQTQGLNRSIRVAVLQPGGARGKEVAQFYETVCKNRGWTSGAFGDREKAIEWLCE